MREIEFRAWQKYHKKMLEVFSIRFADNETRRVVEIGTVSPQGAIPKYIYYHESSKDFRLFDENNEPILTLMQYTGLKDKNGTKIYEGDIIEKTYYSYHQPECSELFEIKYEGLGFHFEHIKGNTFHLPFTEDIEVIGNIYENSELR